MTIEMRKRAVYLKRRLLEFEECEIYGELNKEAAQSKEEMTRELKALELGIDDKNISYETRIYASYKNEEERINISCYAYSKEDVFEELVRLVDIEKQNQVQRHIDALNGR